MARVPKSRRQTGLRAQGFYRGACVRQRRCGGHPEAGRGLARVQDRGLAGARDSCSVRKCWPGRWGALRGAPRLPAVGRPAWASWPRAAVGHVCLRECGPGVAAQCWQGELERAPGAGAGALCAVPQCCGQAGVPQCYGAMLQCYNAAVPCGAAGFRDRSPGRRGSSAQSIHVLGLCLLGGRSRDVGWGPLRVPGGRFPSLSLRPLLPQEGSAASGLTPSAVPVGVTSW